MNCKNPKMHCLFKKDHIWDSATFSCKIGKYLASIIENWVINGDEIIEETKAISINFNENG